MVPVSLMTWFASYLAGVYHNRIYTSVQYNKGYWLRDFIGLGLCIAWYA